MRALNLTGSLIVLGLLVSTVPASAAEQPDTKKFFVDVHELGPGGVTAAAVAEAHEKDLEVQGAYGVSFVKYWVDEEEGRVWCLSEAPDADAVVETHRAAHGLLPARVRPVVEGIEAPAEGGRSFYLDIHRLGPGAVTADAVAEAHRADLATQGRYGVNFLNYWVDEAEGTVWCLAESPDADAVGRTHAEAHGLVPDEIRQVVQGE